MTLISFSEENVGFVQFYFFKYKFLKICKNAYEQERRIEAGMEGLQGFLCFNLSLSNSICMADSRSNL